MELLLKRTAKKSTYTIGHLYVDGAYECDVIEDTDRGLTQNMNLDEIKQKKVQDRTAIPTGRYAVTLDVQSPKYSNYARYPWAKAINAKLPRILDVKGFTGCLIHVGNTAEDTSGCLIVGQNKVVGKVINSTATFNTLYAKLKKADKIYLTIQ